MEDTTERMIYMCKVYEFPNKMNLPHELVERFKGLAQNYVDLMHDSMEYLESNYTTDEDIERFMETLITVYAEAIEEAVDEV